MTLAALIITPEDDGAGQRGGEQPEQQQSPSDRLQRPRDGGEEHARPITEVGEHCTGGGEPLTTEPAEEFLKARRG